MANPVESRSMCTLPHPSNAMGDETKECIEQKLRSIIDARALPMGESQTGRDWCIKALHPSDPLTQVRGIPDESAVPSVFLNYQSMYTLTAPTAAAATDTWNFDMALLPHPINFAAIESHYGAGLGNDHVNHMNTQLTGGTHTVKYGTWVATAQRWRLAYAGVTVYQDAPALSNQGTMVACQTTATPSLVNLDSTAAVAAGYLNVAYTSWQANDLPTFTNSQTMPSAYFNNSKDGLYMPLKLTKTCQQWHSRHDEIANVGVCLNNATPNSAATLTKASTTVQTGDSGFWPHYNLAACTSASAGGVVSQWGDVTSCMCNDVLGHISAQNLGVTTRLTFFYRFGFEIQVQPATILSPEQMLSPIYDPIALRAYFAIARELKDAYPADFNDLGKIWDVIKSIGRTVLPIVSGLGPIGMAVGTIGNAAMAMGDRIKLGIENGRNRPAPADIELARQAISAPAPPPMPSIRIGGKKIRLAVRAPGTALRSVAPNLPYRGKKQMQIIRVQRR